MGFGLISWAAAKGLEGGGKEGVDVAKSAAEHYRLQDHEKFKSDLAMQRETALEKLRQEGADRRLGVTETGADRRLGAQLNFTRSENLLMRTFQASEHKLDRESRERQHTESMAVQRAHVGVAIQQLKLAQEKVTLVPSADGTMQKIGPDGRSMGTLTDISGNPIQGVKDLSAATKEMIGTYKAAIAAVERDIGSEMDPAAKQALRDKRDFYVKAVEQLTGLEGQRPPAAAPTQADVDMLKKNPAQKALFDQKFGAGAADRVLKPDAPKPATPAAAPAAGQPAAPVQDMNPATLADIQSRIAGIDRAIESVMKTAGGNPTTASAQYSELAKQRADLVQQLPANRRAEFEITAR